MRPGRPLQRKTPLGRAPLKRTPKVAQGPRRRRDTGPSKDTRQVVLARAGKWCEVCGRVFEADPHIHHRRPRQMGGSSWAGINLPSNLVAVDEVCHRHIESSRTEAYALGWLVCAGHDPAETPVLRRGLWVWLDNAGRVTPVTGGGAAT